MTRKGHSVKYSTLFLLVLVAALALAGCNAAAMPDDGPEPAISEDASRSVVRRVVAVTQETPSGAAFSVTATQDEVTSFLALGADVLAYYQAAYAAGETPEPKQIPGIDDYMSDAEWQATMDELNRNTRGAARLLLEVRSNIQDPRVYLKDDGSLVLRGYAAVAGTLTPLRLVLAPEPSAEGYAVRFVEGQLGTVAAPEWLSGLIKQALDEGMQLANQSVVITDVAISDGDITVSGTAR